MISMKTFAACCGALAVLLSPVAACDSSGGGGGTPAQTNSVDASFSGSASGAVKNEQSTPQANVFGAGIAGGVLNLWITGQDGTNVSVTIDTAATPLPASVPVGVPTEASAWVSMTTPLPGIYNTFAGSGSVTVNQCPGGANVALTGRFDGVRLRSELDGSEITLNGSFNLVVGAAAGALTCKSAPVTESDTIGGDTSSSGSCEQATCDGPCCPYVACQTQCAFACVTGAACMGGDGPGCNACVVGCWDQCDASTECKNAIGALASCADQHGCDTSGEDTSCAETYCCAELEAAF